MYASTNGDVPDLGMLATLVWQPCGIFWREYLPVLYNGSVGATGFVSCPHLMPSARENLFFDRFCGAGE
jgi:hypothetical protein